MQQKLTQTVNLTALDEADAELIATWKNDRSLSAVMAAQPVPISREQTLIWLKNTQADTRQVIFGIRINQGSDQHLIGILRFMNIDWISQAAEFGMYIGQKELRGKSYGMQSLTAALAYAFFELNLRRVWLRVFASNAPALKLYERTGFKREGCLREHFFANGAHQDMVVMGILKNEFSTPVCMNS